MKKKKLECKRCKAVTTHEFIFSTKFTTKIRTFDMVYYQCLDCSEVINVEENEVKNPNYQPLD